MNKPKIKLSNHARVRLEQRFGILGKKKIRNMTFEHILSDGNNKRLYKVVEINAYFGGIKLVKIL